jgi:hypothetical protein
METTANDRLLHFMAQPPKVEKHGEFGWRRSSSLKYSLYSSATASNSFLPACPRINRKSLLFQPKWIWNKIPDVVTGSLSWRWMSPDLSHYGLAQVGHRAMSEKGQFRQNFAVRAMSGLPPLATELRTSRISSFVP